MSCYQSLSKLLLPSSYIQHYIILFTSLTKTASYLTLIIQTFRNLSILYYLMAYFPDTRCFCLSAAGRAKPSHAVGWRSLINAHIV